MALRGDERLGGEPNRREVLADPVETATVAGPSSPTVAESAADAPLNLHGVVARGRYVVLERIGQGGMGVVYAAYDRRLDRKVALKVLWPSVARTTPGGRPSERLLEEAKVLARLSHPNVVSVHDVDIFEGQVFVTMELVEGVTLAEWCRRRHPGWREIVSLYRQAGRGLAAAHTADLVHRDFKPCNVLVGRDGRVRVLDFGLARPSSDLLHARRAESTAGTPAYMAPEQLMGRPADAGADQFSFCVALYEALYGARPFAGGSVAELARNIVGGGVPPPPAGSRVPARLRLILLRGLEARPEDRFSSMEALIDALDVDFSRSWSRWRAVAAGLVAVAGSVVYLVRLEPAAPPHTLPCEAEERTWQGIWDPSRKAAIRETFSTVGESYGEDVWRGVERRLDEYAAAWSRMHAEACETTHPRGEQSARALDLRMTCLEARREEAHALTDLFAAADGELMRGAVHAVQGLGDLQACADPEFLANVLALPADLESRSRLKVSRRTLARAKAIYAAGRYEEGLELAHRLAEDARVLGYKPFEAQVAYRLAMLQERTGDLRASVASLLDAVAAAEAGRDDALRAEALIRLVWLVGARLGNADEGHRLAHLATAAVDRLGSGRELGHAKLRHSLGSVLNNQGRYEAALVQMSAALEGYGRSVGPDHRNTAVVTMNIGVALASQGHFALAEERFRGALAMHERSLGRNHPQVASSLTNLGVLYSLQGRYDEARGSLRRALTIQERSLRPEDPDLAISLQALADVHVATERPREALPLLERALRANERALGPRHPDVARSLTILGEVHLALTEPEMSLPLAERALAILVAEPGDAVYLAQTRFVLARSVWEARGDRQRARELTAEALADCSRLGGARARKQQARIEGWLRARDWLPVTPSDVPSPEAAHRTAARRPAEVSG